MNIKTETHTINSYQSFADCFFCVRIDKLLQPDAYVSLTESISILFNEWENCEMFTLASWIITKYFKYFSIVLIS